jgi:hypothetical protein
MTEWSEQIQETDFVKILNYYKSKRQFHHQTLMVLYLYTTMRLESIFKLRWRDVYDFRGKAYYPNYFHSGAKEGFEMNKPIAQALTDHMKASRPEPEECILNSDHTSVISFSFRVICKAMDDVWRRCLIDSCVMRQMFKDTGLFRGAQKLQTASIRPEPRPKTSPPKKVPPMTEKNKDYEFYVTKQDLIRLLNDLLEKHQFQSHVILVLYLYSDITIKHMTQIRWQDVYNFRIRSFYSRILPADVPLVREATHALLLYLARYPDFQPEDFILTYRGKPMGQNTVVNHIHREMDRLVDMRYVSFKAFRAWARQILISNTPPLQARSKASPGAGESPRNPSPPKRTATSAGSV